MVALANGISIGGRYRLEKELARGGMGSVWAASDEKLKRSVAIKLMSGDYSESADARTRFENEAMAVAKLSSPHVVQVFDFGIHTSDDGDCYPFIVMEMLEGEDLRRRLLRRKRLSIDEAGDLMTQVGKALSEAHALGIVHRDLKPGNIFLVRQREEELIKVLDFGVAKTSSAAHDTLDAHTKDGALLGTPQFMSPEQARGIAMVDQRADLWSLGVILYRVLTGKLPYDGINVADIIVRLCTDSFVPASELAPDLPPHIDAFFERALARDVEKRFPNARQMAMAFSRHAPVSMNSLNIPAPRASLARKKPPAKPGPVSGRSSSVPKPPALPPPPSIGGTRSSALPDSPASSGNPPLPPPRRPKRTIVGHRAPGPNGRSSSPDEDHNLSKPHSEANGFDSAITREANTLAPAAPDSEPADSTPTAERNVPVTDNAVFEDDFYDDDIPTQVGPRLLQPEPPSSATSEDITKEHFAHMDDGAGQASAEDESSADEAGEAAASKPTPESRRSGHAAEEEAEEKAPETARSVTSERPQGGPSTLGGGTLETTEDLLPDTTEVSEGKAKWPMLIAAAAFLVFGGIVFFQQSAKEDTSNGAAPSATHATTPPKPTSPPAAATPDQPKQSPPAAPSASAEAEAAPAEPALSASASATAVGEAAPEESEEATNSDEDAAKAASTATKKKAKPKATPRTPKKKKRRKTAPSPAPKPPAEKPKPASADPFNERL